VHGGVSDFHFARLPGEKEIDVVSLAISSLHIHAGKIFPVAEVLEPIVVDLYQLECQILPLVFDREFSVGALFAFGLDILLDASRDVSSADLLFRPALRMFCALLRMFGSGCSWARTEDIDVKNRAIAAAIISLVIIGFPPFFWVRLPLFCWMLLMNCPMLSKCRELSAFIETYVVKTLFHIFSILSNSEAGELVISCFARDWTNFACGSR
jgi:hypothetical protein